MSFEIPVDGGEESASVEENPDSGYLCLTLSWRLLSINVKGLIIGRLPSQYERY